MSTDPRAASMETTLGIPLDYISHARYASPAGETEVELKLVVDRDEHWRNRGLDAKRPHTTRRIRMTMREEPDIMLG